MRPFAVLIALTLMACVATPYMREGTMGAMMSGGYTDQKLKPGQYTVGFTGNARTPPGLATRFWHRRAGELCPKGYDVIELSESQEPEGEGLRPVVRGQVRCHR